MCKCPCLCTSVVAAIVPSCFIGLYATSIWLTLGRRVMVIVLCVIHSVIWNCVHFYAPTKARTISPHENFAIWLVDFAKTLAFSSYAWLAYCDGRPALQPSCGHVQLIIIHSVTRNFSKHEQDRCITIQYLTIWLVDAKNRDRLSWTPSEDRNAHSWLPCPRDTCRSDSYCSTALGIRRNLVKKAKPTS